MKIPRYLTFRASAPTRELKKEFISQRGLLTNVNDAITQAGTLDDCSNVVIDKLGVLSSRRGFHATSERKKWQIHGVVPFSDGYLLFTDIGTYFQAPKAPAVAVQSVYGEKIQFPTMPNAYSYGDAVYFSTADGQLHHISRKNDDWQTTNAVPSRGSHVSNLDGVASNNRAWLPPEMSVAYRVCWTRKVGNTTVRGVPSARSIYTNTTAVPVGVRFDVAVPLLAKAGDSLEIYRSEYAKIPSDEMHLVFTKKYAGDERMLTHIDEIAYRERFILYTSTSQQGILGANQEPPLAKTSALYRSMVAYGNIKEPAEIVLGISSLEDLEEGDAIVLETTTQIKLFASTTENIDIGSFAIGSGGATTAENMMKTASSIAHCINAHYANSQFIAIDYSDGENALILIRNLNVAVDFRVWLTTSSHKMDVPNTPSRLSKVFTSLEGTVGFQTDNGVTVSPRWRENVIAFSKPFQVQSVPPSRDVEVGQADKAIVAMAESNGYLFVFKEEGLYRIDGSNPSVMAVTLLDASLRIISPRSLCVLSGKLYAITTKGIMNIHYEGGSLISEMINDRILEKTKMKNADLAFLLADEAEERLIAFFPKNATTPTATTAYVYHNENRQWTKWDFAASGGGFQSETQKLFLYDTQVLYEEEKTDGVQQYCDGLRKIGLLETADDGDVYTLGQMQDADAFTQLHSPTESERIEELKRLLTDKLFFYTQEKLENNRWQLTFDPASAERGIVDGVVFAYEGALVDGIIFLDEALNRVPTKLVRTYTDDAKKISSDDDKPLSIVVKENTTETRWDVDLQTALKGIRLVQLQFTSPQPSLNSLLPLVSGNVYLAKRFRRLIKFNKIRLGSPSVLTDLAYLHMTFSKTEVDTVYTTMATDITADPQRFDVPLTHTGLGFGDGQYSLVPFGGGVAGEVASRISMPRDMRLQRFLSLSLENDTDKHPMTLTSLSAFYFDADNVVK